MTTDFATNSPTSKEALADVIDGLEIHLQPMIDIATGAVWAYEALARFGGAGEPTAGDALEAARRAGYGDELEAACLAAALVRRRDLPVGVHLALNVSPTALLSPAVGDSWHADLTGVLVEITEHFLASDELALDELERLRERGALIAVDDVGSGYAGLLRLAAFHPDVVKLDRTVVSGARDSDAQRAVLETLVAFSHRIDARVVGEGAESVEDLVTLAQFDVDYGQGWAIGRPAPAPEPVDADVVAACHAARTAVLQRRATSTMAASLTHDLHAVTGALGRATELAGLHLATAQAAAHLGVDIVTASVMDEDGVLHEITSSAAIDTAAYAVADYPATRAVLETGAAVEVHASDPNADPAERALLTGLGHASLLMVPLGVGDHRIGVLELMQREHRRWTGTDIANARGLATHLGNALARITS